MRKSSCFNIILLLLICVSAVFLIQSPTYAIEDDPIPFNFEYLYHDGDGYVFELVHQPGASEDENLFWFYLESDDPLYSIGECSDVFTISAGVRYRYSLGYDTGTNYRRYIGIIEYVVLPDEEPYLSVESDGYHYIDYGISESEPNWGIQEASAAYTTNPPTQRYVISTTSTSITWNATAAPSGWSTQYRIKATSSSTWGPWLSNGGAFTGLSPATGYQAQARYTANNATTHVHSEPSTPSTTIWTAPNPPAQRYEVSKTSTSITVNMTAAPSGWVTQYRIRTGSTGSWGSWQDNYGTFTGLNPGTGYQVQARFTANNASTHGHSLESTASATITTQSASRYTLTNSVTNATISPSGANALTQNTAYSGTLSANTGYTRPTSITVMRGTTNITGYVTYNSSTGTISIPAAQVTAAITISGAAVAVPRYTLTNSVTNATINPSGANALTQNTTYSGTLSANTGYTRPTSITVMRGTTNITSYVTYNSSTGAISIPAAQVTAAITISGAAVATPTPTSVAFVQSQYNATIPASGSTPVTVSAQVKDQNGNVMSGYNPTYSLASSYTGVSINSTTGVVTIQSTAAAGTVGLRANYGTLPVATASLALTKTVVPTPAFSLSPGQIKIVSNNNNDLRLTDCIALVKDTSAIVGTITNTPLPSQFKYEFRYADNNASASSSNGFLSVSSKDLSVKAPAAAGKYNLILTFKYGDVEKTLPTYTVYATYGVPRGANEGGTDYPFSGKRLAKDGIPQHWMDTMLGVRPNADTTFTEDRTLTNVFDKIYYLGQNDGWIYFSPSSSGAIVSLKDIPHTLIRGGNLGGGIKGGSCGVFAQMMLELADCVGITGSTDFINYDGYSFLVRNVQAIDNTFNATYTYGNDIENSWLFPDHGVYVYSGTVFDPTLHIKYTGGLANYKSNYVYATALNGWQLQIVGTNKTIQYEALYNQKTHTIYAEIGNGWQKYKYSYSIEVSRNTTMSALSSSESISAVMSLGSSWTAVSNDSWISVGEGTSGEMQAMAPTSISSTISGNDEEMIDIIVAPNTSSQLRTGTVTVTAGGETSTITINQDGANEWMDISQTTVSAAANGKEESIAVTSNVNWRAFVDVDWIELTNDRGVENGELLFVIDNNTDSEERTATILLSGVGVEKTITVSQAGYSVSADATLGDLTVSEGTLTPSFNSNITGYTVLVPYAVDSIDIDATPSNTEASVSVTGPQYLFVGENTFTITVTAQDNISTETYTIIVTREQQQTSYTLQFDQESYEIDAYPGINHPVQVYAYAQNSQGDIVTTPELVSIVYTADTGVSNTSGIFTKEDLEIEPDGGQTGRIITATATFSDGTILEETTVVYAPFINAMPN